MVKKINILTRKNGIWLCIIGIVMFLLNYFTLTWWSIDIDIFGAMITILGLVIAIACGKNMKRSSKWLARRTGVLVCIIAVAVTAVLAYSPFPSLNGDIIGFVGLGVFALGTILIAVRWKY